MRAATDCRRAVTLAALGALLLTACGGAAATGSSTGGTPDLPQGSRQVTLDPRAFTVQVTNRYWPMKPGDRWVYEESDQDGTVTHDEASVLDRTEKIGGIEALAVHDLATQNGVTVEDTTDWYAQDSAGNLWYLGEQTAEHANGQVSSTEGSWRYGEDGAQAGIALPAKAEAGLEYRQEYLAGEAEDQAIVLSTSEQAQTPTGIYTDALLTRDTTPLEPDLVELKWYAPGVGPVLTLTPSGEQTREELVQAPAG
ncbi:MAG TPA: hypothetical protein VIG96_02565 [Blastococcus sp.]